ncbi:MAG: M20 family metallo-hydrolase [Spirochaetaceae bacterium]|jgi:N-carbamoyl-L-amino-acid hydrolase|nr:M20 family metallo-hydrolase [Spirochaetaceae bacterium]
MLYSIEDIRYLETAFSRFYDIGAADSGGVTRLGYSREEDEMHALFALMGEELGLEVLHDQAGNTFLSNTKEGEDYYLIGSHLDSVVDGGRYDGVAGILAGLLVMRWLKRDGRLIPARIGAFRCEESSGFGISTLGSSLVTGGHRDEGLSARAGRDGGTLGEIFAEKRFTLNPEPIKGVRRYLELHIEQGRILQDRGQHIGIVSAIAGPRRFNLYLQGKAEHSGATPMTMRHDALCAAAELILEIERIGRDESPRNSVATVGTLSVSPNAINVIPGEARLQVDIRGVETASLDEMERRIKEAGKSISQRRGIGFLKENISDQPPVSLSLAMLEKMDKIVSSLGISRLRMISGAGHDAMQFAKLCDTALIFIPCRDGVSHNKNEYASIEHICEGAGVLYSYLCEECNEL